MPHKNLNVCFTDRPYRLSHMRSPRGRGSWAFAVWASDLPLIWAPGSMLYGEAKAWARTRVREMQASGERSEERL